MTHSLAARQPVNALFFARPTARLSRQFIVDLQGAEEIPAVDTKRLILLSAAPCDVLSSARRRAVRRNARAKHAGASDPEDGNFSGLIGPDWTITGKYGFVNLVWPLLII